MVKKKEYYTKLNKALPLSLYPQVGYYFWIEYIDRDSDRSHTICSTYKHYPVKGENQEELTGILINMDTIFIVKSTSERIDRN